MMKMFCDCCDAEMPQSRREQRVQATLLRKDGGAQTFYVQVDNNESGSHDVCRACILGAIKAIEK